MKTFISAEVRNGIFHFATVLRRPAWILAWLHGREALWQRMVRDSLLQVRASPIPTLLPDLVKRSPCSDLGRLGAGQEYLYFLVRMFRPSVVVETGVFRGISSSFILQGLEDNSQGRLYSVDLPSASYIISPQGSTALAPAVDASPLKKTEAPGFAIPNELRNRWTLLLGDSRKELPKLLNQVGPIDLFYHDSEHTYEHMTWEFGQAIEHLRPTGILTSDDIGWNSAFKDFVAQGHFSWSGEISNRLGIALVSNKHEGERVL
jgi:predicted O-methyltransferase YrrM